MSKFATVVCSAALIGIVNSAASAQTIDRGLDGLSAFELGGELASSLADGDVEGALGSLGAEIVPILITRGGIPQFLLSQLAGDEIALLISLGYTLLSEQGPQPLCIERQMAIAGVSYEDVVVPGVSERGRLGYLEYEIELREFVRNELVRRAQSTGGSYTVGCLEFEELGLRAALSAEIEALDLPTAQEADHDQIVQVRENDPDTTLWLTQVFGVNSAETWSVFFHNDTEALAFLYFHLAGSAGNFGVVIGQFERGSDGNFSFNGHVRDLYGTSPREVSFEPDSIRLTTTMLAPGDARCCPTGAANWIIDRQTLLAHQQ